VKPYKTRPAKKLRAIVFGKPTLTKAEPKTTQTLVKLNWTKTTLRLCVWVWF